MTELAKAKMKNHPSQSKTLSLLKKVVQQNLRKSTVSAKLIGVFTKANTAVDAQKTRKTSFVNQISSIGVKGSMTDLSVFADEESASVARSSTGFKFCSHDAVQLVNSTKTGLSVKSEKKFAEEVLIDELRKKKELEFKIKEDELKQREKYKNDLLTNKSVMDMQRHLRNNH